MYIKKAVVKFSEAMAVSFPLVHILAAFRDNKIVWSIQCNDHYDSRDTTCFWCSFFGECYNIADRNYSSVLSSEEHFRSSYSNWRCYRRLMLLLLLKMLWLLWRGMDNWILLRACWQQGAMKFSNHFLLWFNAEQLKLGSHMVQAVLTYCRKPRSGLCFNSSSDQWNSKQQCRKMLLRN